MGVDVEDMGLRGNFSVCLRATDRQLQNEINGDNTRCGNADTYGLTRRAMTKANEMIRGYRCGYIIGIIKGGNCADGE